MPKITPEQRRAQSLRRLVNSREWQDLLTEKDEFLTIYAKPIPTDGLNAIVGYGVFKVVSDALEQFIALVEDRAANAVEGHTEEG